LVIGAAFSPVYVWLLPPFDPLPGKTQKEKLQTIDWVGAVLFVAALACLIMGINFGGVKWAWGDGRSIALFVVSGICFIVFGLQQCMYWFCNEQTRLFPIHFLKRRSLLLLFILNSMRSLVPNDLQFDTIAADSPLHCSACKLWLVHLSLLHSAFLPVHPCEFHASTQWLLNFA
jgi:hypothetical protein